MATIGVCYPNVHFIGENMGIYIYNPSVRISEPRNCVCNIQWWHLVRYIPHRPDVIKPALHCCMIYSKPLSPVRSMPSPWRWCFIVAGTRPTFDSFDAWSVWKKRWRCHRDGGRALAINRAILHQQAFVSYQINRIISNQSNHIKSIKSIISYQ